MATSLGGVRLVRGGRGDEDRTSASGGATADTPPTRSRCTYQYCMISLLGVNVQHQRSRHEVRNTIRLAVVDVLATLPWSESSMPLLMVGGLGLWDCA